MHSLKEITNKLEARPIKLKPAWNGPQVSRGIPPKEVRLIKKKNIEVGLEIIGNWASEAFSSEI